MFILIIFIRKEDRSLGKLQLKHQLDCKKEIKVGAEPSRAEP